MTFVFEKTPRISLTCRLVPVQYREYEHGLFLAKKRNSLTLYSFRGEFKDDSAWKLILYQYLLDFRLLSKISKICPMCHC